MHTNNKWTVEVEGAEVLIGRLIKCDDSLLVDTQHRLLPVSLHMHEMPEVVIQWIRRLLLQCLDAIADIKPELDNVANWQHKIQNTKIQNTEGSHIMLRGVGAELLLLLF